MPQLRNRHFFLIDVIVVPFIASISYILRLERITLGRYQASYIIFSLIAVLLLPLIFHKAGIYARYWRYASTDELLLLAGANTIVALLAGALTLAITLAFSVVQPLPRSIPFIFLLLMLAATAAPRLAVRIFDRRSHGPAPRTPPRRVAIMGAGDAGVMLARQIRATPRLGLRVVAFFDDDPSKHHVHIHDIPVRGDRHAIPRLAREHNIQQLIIALPTAHGREIRHILAICEKAGVQTKIIPGIHELLDGTVSVNQIRDVDIEDLLRRQPVQTDTAAVTDLIRGKRVLVTGAGGSIGSELCRQILRCQPSGLILLGRGENSIFTTYHELKAQLAQRPGGPATTLTPIIADVRFHKRLLNIFQTHRPHIVFHAAAHKHVPLMEANPCEAITNNVLGTHNLLRVAQATDVQRLVFISTDKAVNPTSIMGASKRVAELLVHHTARTAHLPYVAVRFGNVLGSRGSVIFTFKRQIANGGPLTVTDPDMTRYFMTIPEAVQLVMQAAVLGAGGEIFVLDMGRPIKIVDLARDLIVLSGLQPGRDVDIRFTGPRPGEKLHEELYAPGEDHHPTAHEKIILAKNDLAAKNDPAANNDLVANNDRSPDNHTPRDLQSTVAALITAAQRNDPPAIHRHLQTLLPEYTPQPCDPEPGVSP